jgi:hypothetical protein
MNSSFILTFQSPNFAWKLLLIKIWYLNYNWSKPTLICCRGSSRFQSSLFNGPINDISISCSISLPKNLFTSFHDITSSMTESHACKLLRCNCHRVGRVVSICHADGQILLLVHTPQPTTLEYPNTSFQSPCYRVMVDAIKVAAWSSDYNVTS